MSFDHRHLVVALTYSNHSKKLHDTCQLRDTLHILVKLNILTEYENQVTLKVSSTSTKPWVQWFWFNSFCYIFQSDITWAIAFRSQSVFTCAACDVLQHSAFDSRTHAQPSETIPIATHQMSRLPSTHSHTYKCMQILWSVFLWLTFACKLIRVHLHAMYKFIRTNKCYINTHTHKCLIGRACYSVKHLMFAYINC